ncbi:hypothetical protein N7532_011239 [Penicillium argentinense]|uniref:Uncharacterized protein n=1 Tax=Penicillium argentinense TaxID=1131581 RepID=A0A9W9EI84_9EURO|nr:uncharacterized protein N7532_011239 [Penicillium argentinense]KAJ5082196.1 hypothetical protein N7532_011239 [Penicillium argentinense]
MPSRKELLALYTLLLQVVARPAPGDGWGSPEDYSQGALELLYSEVYYLAPTQAPADSTEQYGGGGGGKGGPGGPGGEHGGGDGSGYPGPSVTVTPDCPAAPTTTVTITTDDSEKGAATVTVTSPGETVTSTITSPAETITDTISDCTAATTDKSFVNTATETETLTYTISSCTATTTDYATVTADGSTITSTVTTADPTETETTTVTHAAETVTAPASTETQTQTVTETTTDTTTLTDHQIIIQTATTTETKTLEVTSTVTSDDCSETGTNGSDSLGYGSCSDPTIKWEYGLDGRTDYSYTTNNQKDFSFGSSPTIGAPDDLICNRLRSPCNAPQETIDKCYETKDAVANLSGQEAADVWNSMMT